MSLGKRLRKMRTAAGLTQQQLAAPSYTHAYVSTIEAGRRTPSRAAIEFFAAKLGVEPEELLSGRPPDLVPRLELGLHETRRQISRGRVEDAEAVLAEITGQAERFNLTRIEARAEELRGLSAERRGLPEDAIEHYQRAEELLSPETPAARADAVAGKSRAFLALGDVRYGIHLLESLLDRLEREGAKDPPALARLHASLVYGYLEAGLYRKAAESAAELESLAPKVGDDLRLAQMYVNVARLYLNQGQPGDAHESLRRAEDIYRRLELDSERGGAHLARGYVLIRQGSLDEAREQLEQAVELFRATSDRQDEVRALNELGRVERLQGRIGEAREVLERCIELVADSDVRETARAYRELGLALAEEDPTMAEKSLRTAVELYEHAQQPVELAITYRALGDLLRARGDAGGGCEAYHTGLTALDLLD
ncbi:MAG: tetratricopeptide repeat protein [Thermoleophilaceae bacterium]